MKKYSFDENLLVTKLLENGFTANRQNTVEAMCLISWWKNNDGLGAKRLEDKLVEFCKQQNPDFNEILSYGWIKRCVRWGMKKILKSDIVVVITKNELASMSKLSLDLQKIMFTILVVAKALRKTGDKLYLNDYTTLKVLNTIKKLCGLKIDRIKLLHYFYELFQLGLIGNSKDYFYHGEVHMTFEILIVDDNSETEITIDDVDNLINYMPLTCDKCGMILETKTKHSGMCRGCYSKKRKEDVRRNVQKFRKGIDVSFYEF